MAAKQKRYNFEEIIDKGPFSYQIIRSEEAFLALEVEWLALLSRMPFYQPTSTFSWNLSWYRANREKIEEILIFTFRNESGELITIIPFYRYIRRIFGFKLKVIDLFGSRDQIMVNILCISEHHLYIINRVISILYHRTCEWHMISLSRLGSAFSDTIFVERILKKQKIRYNIESMVKVPWLKIEGSYGQYYESLRKQFKREIKRKSNHLSEQGEIRYSVTHSPFSGGELDRFTELEQSGWKGMNQSSLQQRPRLYGLFEALAGSERSDLRLLEFNQFLNDRLISASLCLQTRDGLFVQKIAYDENYSRFSPGLLLRLEEIRYCFEQGLTVYDFSGKYAGWMRFYTSRSHYSMDFIIYRNRFLPLLRFFRETEVKPFIRRHPLLLRWLMELKERAGSKKMPPASLNEAENKDGQD